VLARVRAARRRIPESPTLHVGGLSVEPERRGVTVGETPVALTRREFDVLERLMQASTRVVRRTELLDSLWGYRGTAADASLSEHVRRLRAKLRDAGSGKVIATVRGIGYRIEPGIGTDVVADNGTWAESAELAQ
jgi:DNA-binding response OmpR family regulator